MRVRLYPLLPAALLAVAGGGCLVHDRSAQAYGSLAPDEADGPELDGADEAEAALTAGAEPPPEPLDEERAEQRLAPHGRWVDTPEYGRVFVPAGVPAGWQPYSDGRWVYGPHGWTFVSDEPWGEITYHYGSWDQWDDLGWFWVPGFVWAPAWVSWRYAPGYVCWTPFAPWWRLHRRHWPGWVVVPEARFTSPVRSVRVARPGPILRAARPIASPARAGGRPHAVGHGGGRRR
jgi:hypothetical protein